MDVRMLLTLIFGSVIFIFLIVAYFLYRRDQKIKNYSTEKTKGEVVQYSWQSSRAPVVEYIVDGIAYKKALYYSYVSHFSTLFSSPKVSAKDNLLDTKLLLRGNAMVSLNTLMHDNFPLGTEMMVYYNPKQPKLAYVERYAPNYLWRIFLGISGLFSVILLVIWLVF